MNRLNIDNLFHQAPQNTILWCNRSFGTLIPIKETKKIQFTRFRHRVFERLKQLTRPDDSVRGLHLTNQQ
jgi:hypothetical protein